MVSLSNYKALILAGGKGTRLYPVTLEIPKLLLPVGRKPILNYGVDHFLSYGIKDIAILIGEEFAEDFEWWRKRYYAEHNITFFQEKEPLGTFGGLHFARDWIGENPAFLANGDNLTDVNLSAMTEFHNTLHPMVTIALVEVPNPQEYGVVICDSGYVTEFIEKPENPLSNHVNSGWYLLSPEILAAHPGPIFTMVETDIFPKLAHEKKLAGFEFQGRWIDTGTWERYQQAIEEWGQ